MGCRQGKQKAAKSNGPDAFDAIPEPSTPPPVDPRLPINARQVFKLKKSWKGIKRNMEATGVEMFIRLFRNNKELISLFKDFKDINEINDQLRENEALEHHALLVMSVIDEAICHIDDVDRVIELCTRVGATHSRFTGFTSDLFWNMEEPYLHAIKSELGDRYSDAIDDTYKQIFKFILFHVEEGIKQARERKSTGDHEVLPKYSKAKTTKAELKRQISLSKQEEFFGKDYDKDKIEEILRQESLEREYMQSEARQSTSGLEIIEFKLRSALDVISDKSPVKEEQVAEHSHGDETAPLLAKTESIEVQNQNKQECQVIRDKRDSAQSHDKEPLLDNADGEILEENHEMNATQDVIVSDNKRKEVTNKMTTDAAINNHILRTEKDEHLTKAANQQSAATEH